MEIWSLFSVLENSDQIQHPSLGREEVSSSVSLALAFSLLQLVPVLVQALAPELVVLLVHVFPV